MAHEITNNMLAYKGQTPWHGLGVAVEATMSGAEMLKAAKLDWTVQRRRLAMRGHNGHSDDVLTEPLSGYRAIVREDTDEVFQVATSRYYPVQNEEVVDFFRRYCEAGHATMETVGGLRGGAIVFALAKLAAGAETILQGVDEMTGYMLLATSHDGSLRTIGKPTSVRVVCWNTLSAAIGENSKGSHEFRRKHTRKWDSRVADEAQRVMGMAVEAIREQNTLAGKLAEVSIDQAGRLEFVRRVLGGSSILEAVVAETQLTGSDVLARVMENSGGDSKGKDLAESRVGKAILEAIVSSPGSDLVTARNTLWGAVNGVSWYTDHERGRNADSRLAGAWFGAGDKLKNEALTVAAQMAGVN